MDRGNQTRFGLALVCHTTSFLLHALNFKKTTLTLLAVEKYKKTKTRR
jgi:hypothetical protein